MATMEDSLPDGRSTTLWVLRDNQRAIRFYEKLGYRPGGAQKDISIGGRGFCEVRFQKKIKSKAVDRAHFARAVSFALHIKP